MCSSIGIVPLGHPWQAKLRNGPRTIAKKELNRSIATLLQCDAGKLFINCVPLQVNLFIDFSSESDGKEEEELDSVHRL